METFICENVFVPLRSGPSHKSEMLSQILFGERYVIKDQLGKWAKIETLFDNYTGWIDLDHLQHSAERENIKGYVLNKSLLCFKKDKSKLVLEPGCEIYNPDFKKKHSQSEKAFSGQQQNLTMVISIQRNLFQILQ
jgi:gamma-D-glutamyl-L-lysine dipeptidyl-peptidase